MWEYYSKFIGWIFKSRIKVILRSFKQMQPKPVMMLDVGYGPLFISCSLVSNSSGEYVGVDLLPAKRLRKYKDVVRKLGLQRIVAIRASAEFLTLKKCVFDFLPWRY